MSHDFEVVRVTLLFLILLASAAVTGNPNTETIVDNLDANTSYSGTWLNSVGANPYQGNSVYCDAGCTFTWQPVLPRPGTYEVYAYWTYREYRSSTVPYRVDNNDGTATVLVDQHNQLLASQWNLLGTYALTPGANDTVTVSSENGQASADAVRYVLINARTPISDYNGDGKADILWRNIETGQNWMYLMNGSSVASSLGVNTVAGLDWNIVGNGDYNGDGNSDILWRNTATGQNWMYLMNGASIGSSVGVNTVPAPDWKIVADGDYNGDGRADILWRNSITGQNWLYLMNGASIVSSVGVNTVPSPDWKIVSDADYNGDMKADILWRNFVTGQNWLYLMNGASIVSSLGVNTVPAPNWRIVADGDYNGDGNADILWRNIETGQNSMYLMNGASIVSKEAINTVPSQDWLIGGNGDYNGDGNADILWRNIVTGQNWIYLMNGASIAGSFGVNTVATPNWEIMIGMLRGSSGLQQRPLNLSCIAPDQPTVNTSISTNQVFAGIGTLAGPIALVQAAEDASHWYLVEKNGVVYKFANSDSASSKDQFIDITGVVNSDYSESGLLGLAFHPDYETNHFAYLSYTATGPGDPYSLTSRLSRFESVDDGLTLDPSTEVILLSQDQPYTNHNGGNISFGPDGYLYLGLGDGGSAGDPGNRAQNTKNLFGAISRIDVDSGSPYGIPADNPFAGNALCNVSTTGSDAFDSCPELYAWGLRNPWRWSFDSLNGTLWLADVGQNAFEEVDIIERGGNYGWSIQEGFACYNPSSACNTSNLVQPLIAYGRNVGTSITGGFVYRGTEIPELIGRYVFADYGMGKIFATTSLGDGSFDYELLVDTKYYISSFGEDASGELYFLVYAGSTPAIRRINEFEGISNDTIAAALSDTGCVANGNAALPASGLVPYDTNETFWSDAATKDRYFAIPDSSMVEVDINGDWQFPVGTVLVKNFRLAEKLIETRHMMRHTNGEWAGYTYEWNDAQTEATRVIGGKSTEIAGQTWAFPSETQCMMCHTSAAGFSLGIEHAQLNKDFLYPGTGITANQLSTADKIDILTDPLTDSPGNLPSLRGQGTPSTQDQVRSYLHVNCSECHRPLGPTQSNMDLRFDTAWSAMNLCDVVPTNGTLGITDARIIALGDAARSVLVNRMNRRDVHGMPPLGSNLVDTAGVDLLATWIDGLTACPQ